MKYRCVFFNKVIITIESRHREVLQILTTVSLFFLVGRDDRCVCVYMIHFYFQVQVYEVCGGGGETDALINIPLVTETGPSVLFGREPSDRPPPTLSRLHHAPAMTHTFPVILG